MRMCEGSFERYDFPGSNTTGYQLGASEGDDSVGNERCKNSLRKNVPPPTRWKPRRIVLYGVCLHRVFGCDRYAKRLAVYGNRVTSVFLLIELFSWQLFTKAINHFWFCGLLFLLYKCCELQAYKTHPNIHTILNLRCNVHIVLYSTCKNSETICGENFYPLTI